MFGRLTAESIRQTASSMRHHICHSYGIAKRMAQTIDYGVSTAARAYKAIQPILKDAVPDAERKVTSRLSSLKGDYNQLRDRVRDVDDKATSVVHTLKKKVPELNL